MNVPAPDPQAGPSDVAAPADFESVMARCLQRLDEGDESTVDELARQHPQYADRLRRRVQLLLDAGLLRGGRRFGPYRVVDALDRGGMGVVYKALDERSETLVALKALPSRLVGNPRSRARFEREARAAASLRHPGIVPMLEVGESDDVPWYAMAYVDGRTLAQVLESLSATHVPAAELETTHLDQALGGPTPPPEGGASRRGRQYVDAVCLLVHDVAEALAHAHAQGVVHRDIKPSNILVRRDGRALLFDFGLARGDDDESLTLTGDFAGTPHYVSPEQVAPRGRRVDARTDIYSLGVTLYELLTLRRPFEAGSLEEATRNILDRDAVPVRRLNPAVPRDLATICAKAMEKDPERRYATAADLAADLARLLEDAPIVAQPPGLAARAWRWVARRRAAVAAGVLLAVLVLGTPLMLWRTNVVLRAEAARTERVNAFLQSLFESPSPYRAGRDVTLTEVLDVAVASLGAEFGDDPLTEGALRRTLAQTYMHLGRMDEAQQQFEAAVAVLTGLERGSAPAERAQALRGLGVVLSNKRIEFERAEALMREALAIQRSLPTAGVDEVANTLMSLSNHRLVQDDKQGGEALAREALELAAAHADASPLTLSRARTALGALLWRQRNYDEAEALLRAALDTQVELLVAGHPRHVRTGMELGGLYLYRGEPERAEGVYRELLPPAVEVLGDDHPDVARLRQLLSRTLASRERWAEVEALLEQVVPVYRRAYPDGHDHLASALTNLGRARFQTGRRQDAVAPMQEALDMYRGVWGEHHPMVGEAAINLSWVLEQADRVDESEAVLTGLREGYAERYGADHFLHTMVLERLVGLNERAGREAAAGAWRELMPAGQEPPPGH